MELLNVQRARSVWLLHLDDLNPRGKDIQSDLLDWLKDNYQFTKTPSSLTDLDETKALYFGGGSFQIREEIFIGVELRVYNDGLVADTRSSTEDTDTFLSDLIQSAAKEFNLVYRPEVIRKKSYVSELVVKMSSRLDAINSKMDNFAHKLTNVMALKSPMEMAGISFWSDSNPAETSFRLERKWGAEFSENRYYARASMQTSAHQDMLNELEMLFSS